VEVPNLAEYQVVALHSVYALIADEANASEDSKTWPRLPYNLIFLVVFQAKHTVGVSVYYKLG
jgi:hypothetical protein